MKNATKKMRELGLSDKLIRRVTRRLNRRNWFLSRDIKDITINDRWIYFWSNHWDKEVMAFPHNM